MLYHCIIHTLGFFIVKFTVYVDHPCGWVCVHVHMHVCVYALVCARMYVMS